ncbi:hypothetical protein Goarm_023367, partial [Gossypium armourianum]|nr:hypothetical protein [Gossypium armourianum]
INTCNGRHCGDTFYGPNKRNKPALWTENWTAQYRVFGDPPSQRSAEDLAYSVARFFSKNGSMVNYYMYYGGTNFGRTSASFTTTRYYDEGPLDEFGLQREPKWGHLKDVHRALSLCKRALFWGVPTTLKLGPDQQAIVWQQPGTSACAAFLANNNTRLAQHFDVPRELFHLTKDTTDYAWYTTSLKLGRRDLPMKKNVRPVLRVASLGHGIHAYVNGEYAGSAHGSKVEKSFVFQRAVSLKEGENHIALLGYLVGLPDSGAYMEKRFAGPRSITILGLNTGTLDISQNGWGHQVGIDGEKKKLFTEEGSKSVQWTKPDQGGPLTWYKGYFDAPEGDNPVAIVMTGMGKGMVWINGRSIGRYWNNYLSPLKKPTQSEYEEEGNPKDVHIVTVNRDTICSAVSEIHPPSPRLFETKNGSLQPKVNDLKPRAELICPGKKQIVAVEFASYGDPFGACGAYFIGNCTAPESKQVVEKYCLGKPSCQIPLDSIHFSDQNDACTHLRKTLAVQ